MDDQSAQLHAANLRVAWEDGDRVSIARQVAYIPTLYDAQDIILALLTASGITTEYLRELLVRETAFPDDEERVEGL